MGYLLCIVFLITGCICTNEIFFVVAALFAIAGSISSFARRITKDDSDDE